MSEQSQTMKASENTDELLSMSVEKFNDHLTKINIDSKNDYSSNYSLQTALDTVFDDNNTESTELFKQYITNANTIIETYNARLDTLFECIRLDSESKNKLIKALQIIAQHIGTNNGVFNDDFKLKTLNKLAEETTEATTADPELNNSTKSLTKGLFLVFDSENQLSPINLPNYQSLYIDWGNGSNSDPDSDSINLTDDFEKFKPKLIDVNTLLQMKPSNENLSSFTLGAIDGLGFIKLNLLDKSVIYFKSSLRSYLWDQFTPIQKTLYIPYFIIKALVNGISFIPSAFFIGFAGVFGTIYSGLPK
jgi:hypothetical protein